MRDIIAENKLDDIFSDDFDFYGAGAKGGKPDKGDKGNGWGKGGNPNKGDEDPTDPPPEPTGPTEQDPWIDDGSYSVDVTFLGAWTQAQMDAYMSGVNWLESYVIGDLPDVTYEDGTVVDDLHVTAEVAYANGHWAFGGPRAFRSDGTTYEGYTRIDDGRIDQAMNYGVVDDFAFHEILHAMGFGTGSHWNSFEDIAPDGSYRFTGELATALYTDPNSAFAGIADSDPYSDWGVPLQDGGAHLSEQYFSSDIITPTIGTSNTVSDITLAILEDLGYETIWDETAYV